MLSRDKYNEDEVIRNTTHVILSKNRSGVSQVKLVKFITINNPIRCTIKMIISILVEVNFMEILREYLKYDPESISGLVWIKLNKNSHVKTFQHHFRVGFKVQVIGN